MIIINFVKVITFKKIFIGYHPHYSLIVSLWAGDVLVLFFFLIPLLPDDDWFVITVPYDSASWQVLDKYWSWCSLIFSGFPILITKSLNQIFKLCHNVGDNKIQSNIIWSILHLPIRIENLFFSFALKFLKEGFHIQFYLVDVGLILSLMNRQ